MSAHKKPRADAVLKTLPPDRQATIAEYLRDHTLVDTRKWLAADGFTTSEAALSSFLAWWSLQQQLTRNESTVAQMLADLKQNNPALKESDMQQAGQMFFSALAIEQQDSLSWKRVQDAKAKLGLLEVTRHKFLLESDAFMARLLDKAKELLANTGLSQADRIAEMRKAAFKDVEELEKSGLLVIPK